MLNIAHPKGVRLAAKRKTLRQTLQHVEKLNLVKIRFDLAKNRLNRLREFLLLLLAFCFFLFPGLYGFFEFVEHGFALSFKIFRARSKNLLVLARTTRSGALSGLRIVKHVLL